MRRIVKTALIWAAITLGFCAAVIEAARAEEKCAAVGRIIITDYGATAETGDGGMVWVPKTQVRFDDEGPLRVCVGSYTGPRLYIPSDAWPQFAGDGGSVLHPVHDGYEKWMQPPKPTVSCCNKQDCEPVEGRFDDRRKVYQAKIEGEWVDIPPQIILDPKKPENATPDGSFHACWNRSTKELLCFREADPKI